jgi:hypothetical protein
MNIKVRALAPRLPAIYADRAQRLTCFTDNPNALINISE